jgi:hypothetical protein
MKKENIFKEIIYEMLLNWEIYYDFNGIKRKKLMNLSQDKNYKIRKTIAFLRRKKIIVLVSRRYYIKIKNLELLKW